MTSSHVRPAGERHIDNPYAGNKVKSKRGSFE